MTSSDLAVRVRTPSRLHFGLLAIGDSAPRQFGGVGVMIERPATQITLSFERPRTSKPDGLTAQRACAFGIQFHHSLNSDEQRRVPVVPQINVDEAAPEHVGLGSGTQLVMAVARALAAFVGRSDMPAEELARRVGRGSRSAVGVHGFQLGGFIVEGGKTNAAQISPLVARLNFPPDWHFVLIIPKDAKGLHGAAEREAFDSLPSIPTSVTADLCRMTMLGMLPAVAERDFRGFSESLVEFGRKVGESFASHQGGVYASPLAGGVIDVCLRHGIRGVAQSSWGPTLAAVVDSRFRAEWLAARLADSLGSDAAQFLCTPANNLGAKTEVVTIGGVT